jgi:L-rhamnonate dehydratase
MKITDVETIYLRLPDVDALRCDGTQDALIILVHTDEGITGIGEVDTAPTVARAIIEAPSSHLIANGLKELIIGMDPFEIELIWHKMYHGTLYYGRSGPALHAMSGIDIALWDIIGKATKRPVAQMLGGIFQSKILAYASLVMPDTIPEAVKMAEKYKSLGYQAIKFGWGPFGRDERFDVDAIRSIRNTLGDDFQLMIDIGHIWDVKTAIHRARRFEEYNVYWLEEPLPPEDYKGYAQLTGAVDMYIAAGEQDSGRISYERLIRESNIDIIQPDLGRCGGLTEGKKIATMAYDRNKKVVPHAFKTGVLVSASTHFVANMPHGFLMEFTVSDSPLARNLVKNPVSFQDGYVTLPTASGLGIELDPQVVAKYKQ